MGKSSSRAGFPAGGLYAVRSPGRRAGWQLAAILQADPGGAHLSLFNVIHARPPAEPPRFLSCALRPPGPDGREIVTVAHVPVSWELFRRWKPVLVGEGKVDRRDLKAVRAWERRHRTTKSYFDGPFWNQGVPFVQPEHIDPPGDIVIQQLWADA